MSTSSAHTLQDHTVLITGGAGFIGSHLARSLVGDNEVRVLDDLSTGTSAGLPDEVTLIRGDVRDEGTVREAMADVDVVYHLAAIVDVDRSVEDPQYSHSVNVDGTLTVLEAARRAQARTVLASSAAVYGHPESLPISEDAPTNPISPYGLDKLAADRYSRLYHELYDLPTVVLRLFNVFGPGQQGGDSGGVIDIFTEQAQADKPITVHGEGMQSRDFVHVRDVVDAFRRAATTDWVGEAFNIGAGERVTIRELAETIRHRTRSASEIIHTDSREGDIEHSQADITKARETLGYQPDVTLAAGIDTLLEDETCSFEAGRRRLVRHSSSEPISERGDQP